MELSYSDFHLVEEVLGCQYLDKDVKGKDDVITSWIATLLTTFFNAGIQILASLYNKCLNVVGDYVEK